MKKILLIALVLIGIGGMNEMAAQVRVNINVGQQPAWGPKGYDYAEYYYMPDMDAYYYVPQRQFIYMDRGRWVTAYDMPARYRGYDLYTAPKYVINEPKPYLRHDYYRSRYAGNSQVIIRDKRDGDYDDDRYYSKKWKKNKGHGRGHAYGHYK
jgi:hypothetical protein